jgi:hypothetical protein
MEVVALVDAGDSLGSRLAHFGSGQDSRFSMEVFDTNRASLLSVRDDP